MITIESSRNKDIIVKCKNTPANLTILKAIVEVFNILDLESTFELNKGVEDNEDKNDVNIV